MDGFLGKEFVGEVFAGFSGLLHVLSEGHAGLLDIFGRVFYRVFCGLFGIQRDVEGLSFAFDCDVVALDPDRGVGCDLDGFLGKEFVGEVFAGSGVGEHVFSGFGDAFGEPSGVGLGKGFAGVREVAIRGGVCGVCDVSGVTRCALKAVIDCSAHIGVGESFTGS